MAVAPQVLGDGATKTGHRSEGVEGEVSSGIDGLDESRQGDIGPAYAGAGTDVDQRLAALEPEFGPRLRECERLWTSTRETVRDQTGSDSDGRRAADIARSRCEDPLLAELSAAIDAILSPTSPAPADQCVGDRVEVASLIDASSASSGLRVFTTCASDSEVPGVLGLGHPVRAIGLTDGSGLSLADAVTAVFDAYAQRTDGYAGRQITPIHTSVSDGTLTVTLPPTAGSLSLAATGQIDRFLAEIMANALQFSQVDSLRINIDGNCHDFWAMTPFGTCRLIDRSGVLEGWS
jgi:hypothetical protein